MSDRPAQPEENKLKKSLTDLRSSVDSLRVNVEKDVHVGYSLSMAFLKGVAGALGAVTVAVLVIPFVVWFLHQIQWVPLTSDFVNQVLQRIERNDK